MEALTGLRQAIPEWHALLDNLNGQIAQRQIELAQCAENQPAPRSLKNKGSTESLRPKDGQSPAGPGDDGPKSTIDMPPLPRIPAYSASSAPLVSAPPLLHSSTSPALLQTRSTTRPSPHSTVQRMIAKAIPSTPPLISRQPLLRKRKTGSMISADSQQPRYRTRSMIIVYYDSAVQDAFEELVKHISSSRNAMRKGKMAARMSDMKRLAELEVDEEDDDLSLGAPAGMSLRLPPGFSTRLTASSNERKEAAKGYKPPVVQADSDDDDDDDEVPDLRYVSTRRMGPSRDASMSSTPVGKQRPSPGNVMSGPGMSLRMAPSINTTIFDELDAGLEWCQSMCEHAAHQFLRDGECGVEIEGIKQRLSEVGTATGLEIDRATAKEHAVRENQKPPSSGEASPAVSSRPTSNESRKSRELREITVRRPSDAVMTKVNRVRGHDVEVDEGVEDMDIAMD